MNVGDAYAQCETITNEQAKNFSYGIRLLPAPKRPALSAVYALARRIDDIGDGDLPAARKLEAAGRRAQGASAHGPGAATTRCSWPSTTPPAATSCRWTSSVS